MRIIAIFLCALFGGCGGREQPQIFRQQANKIEAYYNVNLSIYDELTFYIFDTQLEIIKACDGKSDIACSVMGFSSIVIRRDYLESCEVVTHELLHFALEKLDPASNRNHSGQIWSNYNNLFCGAQL